MHLLGFSMKQNPSIGMDLFTKTIIVSGKTVKLNIWDTAGQDKYFSLTRSLFQKADGVLLTFDLTDTESFKSNLNTPSLQLFPERS